MVGATFLIYLTHLLENIYYLETGQSFAFVIRWKIEWVAQKFEKFERSIVSNPKVRNSFFLENSVRDVL